MVTTTLISLAALVSGGIVGAGLYAAGKKAGVKVGKDKADMEALMYAMRTTMFQRNLSLADNLLPLVLACSCLSQAGVLNGTGNRPAAEPRAPYHPTEPLPSWLRGAQPPAEPSL